MFLKECWRTWKQTRLFVNALPDLWGFYDCDSIYDGVAYLSTLGFPRMQIVLSVTSLLLVLAQDTLEKEILNLNEGFLVKLSLHNKNKNNNKNNNNSSYYYYYFYGCCILIPALKTSLCPSSRKREMLKESVRIKSLSLSILSLITPPQLLSSMHLKIGQQFTQFLILNEEMCKGM